MILPQVELFAGLSTEALGEIAVIFEPLTLAPDEVLFRSGDEADRFYIVEHGFLEVQPAAGGPLLSLGRGQTVGEMTLVDRGRRSATVRAAGGEARVLSVSWAAFDAFCEANPATGYRIMRNLAADLSFRLRRMNE